MVSKDQVRIHHNFQALPDAAATRAQEVTPMLPGIIVLNYNYFPDTIHSPARVGASAFALSAMEVLGRANLFRGVILYKRQERLQQPIISMEVRNSVLCATISFNYTMETGCLKEAISAISEALSCNDEFAPMLYYQTDTLLQYHPDDLPLCVTHHAPFYEDFAHHFSESSAGTAFGSLLKARHLHVQQSLGIELLKARDNAFVFQHSHVQGHYLAKNGIDAAKVFDLCPPIHSMRIMEYPEIAHTTLGDIVSRPGILLFTAVARLDYFKDIDLLVDTALQLHRERLPITVLIAGDDEEDHDRRAELYGRLPSSYRKSFHIVPRLRKNILYSLFEHCRHKSIFVCPSRYETLGITPLESGLRGITTLISNSKQVEARRFFPDENCFLRTTTHLASVINCFAKANLFQSGKELQKHLEKVISERKFRSDFLHAWQECSQWVKMSSSPM